MKIFTLLFIIFFAFKVSANTLFVAPNGNDVSNNCNSNLNPCQSIFHAISIAGPNNIIQLDQGIFPIFNTIALNFNISIIGNQGVNISTIASNSSVAFQVQSSTFSLTSLTFANTSSVIAIINGTLMINSCIFNNAIADNTVISLNNSNAFINDLLMTNCVSNQSCIEGDIGSPLNIINSQFTNSMTNNAMYGIITTYGTLHLQNVTFYNINNNNNNIGYALLSYNNCTIVNCNFQFISGYEVMYFTSNFLNISNTYFNNLNNNFYVIEINPANNNNSVVYITNMTMLNATNNCCYNFINFDQVNNSTVTITNSLFAYSVYGPVLEFYSGYEVSIDNCIFSNNVAGQNSGAIDFEGTSLTITNSLFINNTASNNLVAGAISMCTSTTNMQVFIQNTTFFGNSNSNSQTGGAISVYSCGALFTVNMVINDCTFINNFGVAGVLYLGYNSVVTVSNSIIQGNTGIGYSIAYIGANSTLDIESSSIINNGDSSINYTIACVDGALMSMNNLIRNNSAAVGQIYCLSCTTDGFINSTCKDCKSEFYGYLCSPCNCNHGNCDDGISGTGTCTCPEGFNQTTMCADCESGFYGPSCQPCTVNCNNHGNCDDGISGTGTCNCDSGYSGNCAQVNSQSRQQPLFILLLALPLFLIFFQKI